jgi:hypothetical protein
MQAPIGRLIHFGNLQKMEGKLVMPLQNWNPP